MKTKIQMKDGQRTIAVKRKRRLVPIHTFISVMRTIHTFMSVMRTIYTFNSEKRTIRLKEKSRDIKML
jgi:hypothetical protein